MGTELLEGLLYFWGFLSHALLASVISIVLGFILVSLPYIGILYIPLGKDTFRKFFVKKTTTTSKIPPETLSLAKRLGDYSIQIIQSNSLIAYVKDFHKKVFYISSTAIETLSVTELKYFVAHEIGHIQLEHLPNRVTIVRYFLYASTLIYLFMQPSYSVALLFSLAFAFYFFHMFRADEDAADRFAVEILGAALVIKAIKRLSDRKSATPKFLRHVMYHRFGNEKIAQIIDSGYN